MTEKQKQSVSTVYSAQNIQVLEGLEAVRKRPGMYIGKLGDGSSKDDGIYVLLKEVIDNSIDEHVMGYGKTIEVKIENGTVSVRDFGRGIPLGKVVECVSKINTGGKYDSKAFQKSVGLNGVGTKAVNALSGEFIVQSFRDGRTKYASFSKGNLVKDEREKSSTEKNGTIMSFVPDVTIFRNFKYNPEYVSAMLWNYVYLNKGLTIEYNGEKFFSENGLKDLLENNLTDELLYPIVHIHGDDIEVAFTHTTSYGEDYFSFVNGQHTTQGGTHQAAYREAIVKTIREFFKKDFDPSDVRTSITAAISVRVQDPVFES